MLLVGNRFCHTIRIKRKHYNVAYYIMDAKPVTKPVAVLVAK